MKAAGAENPKKSSARHLRWRARHPEKRRAMRAAQKRRYYHQFQRAPGPRRRKLWTPGEDARITAKNRPTDRKLSKALRRSTQAIQIANQTIWCSMMTVCVPLDLVQTQVQLF